MKKILIVLIAVLQITPFASGLAKEPLANPSLELRRNALESRINALNAPNQAPSAINFSNQPSPLLTNKVGNIYSSEDGKDVTIESERGILKAKDGKVLPESKVYDGNGKLIEISVLQSIFEGGKTVYGSSMNVMYEIMGVSSMVYLVKTATGWVRLGSVAAPAARTLIAGGLGGYAPAKLPPQSLLTRIASGVKSGARSIAPAAAPLATIGLVSTGVGVIALNRADYYFSNAEARRLQNIVDAKKIKLADYEKCRDDEAPENCGYVDSDYGRVQLNQQIEALRNSIRAGERQIFLNTKTLDDIYSGPDNPKSFLRPMRDWWNDDRSRGLPEK